MQTHNEFDAYGTEAVEPRTEHEPRTEAVEPDESRTEHEPTTDRHSINFLYVLGTIIVVSVQSVARRVAQGVAQVVLSR